MAVLDKVVNITSVANNAFLDVQPGAGVEWVIHNLMFGGAFELYWYDGTNSILIDSEGANGGRTNLVYHVTNGVRLRMKNTSGGTTFLGYSGVITK